MAINQQALQPVATTANDWQLLQQRATVLVKSGFLPLAIKTPEQAIAIIMTGRELNVPEMAALRSITVIQGTPSVSPQLMLALIKRTRELEAFELDVQEQFATCTMKRKGEKAHVVTFGKKEADALGLSSKDNYKKQPKVMYQWRAVAACARVAFPDVVLGLYTPDELGAEMVENDVGDLVVNVTPKPVPIHTVSPNTLPPAPPIPTPAEHFDREAIEKEILDVAGQLGYSRQKLDAAINKRYEVSDGLDALGGKELVEVLAGLRERLAVTHLRDQLAAAFSAAGWEATAVADWIGEHYDGRLLTDLNSTELREALTAFNSLIDQQAADREEVIIP